MSKSDDEDGEDFLVETSSEESGSDEESDADGVTTLANDKSVLPPVTTRGSTSSRRDNRGGLVFPPARVHRYLKKGIMRTVLARAGPCSWPGSWNTWSRSYGVGRQLYPR
jgi:hypothetical protein